MSDKIRKSDAEWRAKLTEEQYHVTRKKGTEPPFTGEYDDTETSGTYVCVCCGQPLFSSDAKFHSGSGWPSYYQPIAAENVEMERDVAHKEWYGLKCSAAAVMRIWDTFSTTAPTQRASASASTPPPSTFRRKTRRRILKRRVKRFLRSVLRRVATENHQRLPPGLSGRRKAHPDGHSQGSNPRRSRGNEPGTRHKGQESPEIQLASSWSPCLGHWFR